MSFKRGRRRRKEKLRENREARAELRKEKLMSMKAKPRYKKEFKVWISPEPTRMVETEEMKRIRKLPSLENTGWPIVTIKAPMPKNKEMARREKAAREESERRKTQVAPLYNKGAYEYIGGVKDKEIIKNLGKKI